MRWQSPRLQYVLILPKYSNYFSQVNPYYLTYPLPLLMGPLRLYVFPLISFFSLRSGRVFLFFDVLHKPLNPIDEREPAILIFLEQQILC